MKPVSINRFENELETLSQSSQMRFFPKIRNNFIDLSSNSYLNLHENENVNEKARVLCGDKYFGALASRLVMQNTPLFEILEETICKWKNCENILLFNSGFLANLGIIQALASPNSAVFSDRLNHASIIDGIRLSGAKLFRYNHCGYEHLQELLESSPNSEKLIVSDAVFSMDGDCADIKKLVEIAEKYGAFLLIDEAHSAGIFGEFGRGLCDNIKSENLLVMGTLSKAIAGMGAYLQCSDTVKKYLINKCRPLIFSTALPQSVLAWNIAAIKFLCESENKYLGQKLIYKAADFREKLTEIGVNFGKSESMIVPIIAGGNENALELSKKFRENGLYIPAIRPPTVPANSARCRISLNLGVSDDTTDKIITVLKEVKI